MWKEAVVAEFEVLYANLSGVAEEKPGKPRTGPELVISRI
jgi:hypothetical protein